MLKIDDINICIYFFLNLIFTTDKIANMERSSVDESNSVDKIAYILANRKNAFKYNYFQKIEDMLIDNNECMDEYSRGGNTPLHLSVIHRSECVLNLFINNGADINKPNINNGQTALHIAARNNRINLVEILINEGADIDIKDNEGKTAHDLSKCELIKNLLKN
jgi:ankyrin repeat protein